MNYTEFLTVALPYTHWKFSKKRPNNGSALVLIADTYYVGDPLQDFLIIMDVRPYGKGDARVFKKVPALDFFTLNENQTIMPAVPVA